VRIHERRSFQNLMPLKQLVLATAWLALAAFPCHAAEPSSWKSEVIADDLAYRWAVNRSGPAIVIAEAAGTIVIVGNGKRRRSKLQTSSPAAREGRSGFLGMAHVYQLNFSGTKFDHFEASEIIALLGRLASQTNLRVCRCSTLVGTLGPS
jgi:glucose/arabinose dehydrogenase